MNTIDAKLLKQLFIAGAEALDSKKEYVNELNVFPVPDGDTGTNMTMTIKSASKEVLAIESVTMENVCKAISSGSLRGARGNSGVILSQLLRGLTKKVRDYEEIDTQLIAAAFEKAVETAYKAVMKPKEGTILTVARAGSEMAVMLANENLDIVTFMETIIKHMREVLDQTPEMLPVLKEAGVVDSGGEGLLVIIEGAFELLKEKRPKPADAKSPDLSRLKRDSQSKKNSSKSETISKARPEPVNRVKQEHKSVETIKKTVTKEPRKSKADISTADIKFGYCTEFIILLETEFGDNSEAEFKIFLEAIGDSIVVVADDDIVKVHVHTNMPGIAIQKALTYGSLTSMKIDNMREEHNERLMLDEEAAKAGTSQQSESDNAIEPEQTETVSEVRKQSGEDESVTSENVNNADVSEKSGEDEGYVVEEMEEDDIDEDYDEEKELDQASDELFNKRTYGKSVGFITVSAGEGLSEIFAGLGADVVIEGGQTMNPSTEDILNAIDQIDAGTIFIMPNNSNIILAAQQASCLEEEKNIIVIPSKTIPQGIMAMLNFMSTRTVEENQKIMMSEMANVKSGAITYSIRDTVIQGKEIKQGDIMGIGDSSIMNVGAQVMATTIGLVDELIEEDSELVTLYYGKETTEDEANLIADGIKKKHPDVDVEVHYGGQPVYYYYLSVE